MFVGCRDVLRYGLNDKNAHTTTRKFPSTSSYSNSGFYTNGGQWFTGLAGILHWPYNEAIQPCKSQYWCQACTVCLVSVMSSLAVTERVVTAFKHMHFSATPFSSLERWSVSTFMLSGKGVQAHFSTERSNPVQKLRKYLSLVSFQGSHSWSVSLLDLLKFTNLPSCNTCPKHLRPSLSKKH